ncbi:DUF262 domain-containing protein [Rhizocola hellebori]|uniref:DUF262 domain-containing protein n=1 Tax=Rhizocola hellebori TaxID=1392758 RepID=UPI0019436424|nr:DUF262 domain-containing protein [Rhizocola hellebori]
MGLEEQVASRAREIHSDGFAMSIGSVISLYRDGGVDIHSEFQRVPWTDDQRSRFIESILLGLPIPPVIVSQRPDGVWDVIDGARRLSTIFQFVGIYRDRTGNLATPTTLRKTEYLPALDGYRWEVMSTDGLVFSERMRRDFEAAKLHFRITSVTLQQIAFDLNGLRHQASAGSKRTFWAGLVLGIPLGLLVNWLSSLFGIGV